MSKKTTVLFLFGMLATYAALRFEGRFSFPYQQLLLLAGLIAVFASEVLTVEPPPRAIMLATGSLFLVMSIILLIQAIELVANYETVPNLPHLMNMKAFQSVSIGLVGVMIASHAFGARKKPAQIA